MAGILRNAYTAVIARGEPWQGQVFTEPYEAAWAAEALFFVRVLDAIGAPDAMTTARIQISPDGMHWVDEGAALAVAARREALAFARCTQFGGWLRLAVDVPVGTTITVVATLALKA